MAPAASPARAHPGCRASPPVPLPSPHRLLLPPANELVEGDVVHLDYLVPDAGDAPVRPAHAAADPLHEDLVVLVDEVDRAVADCERGDLPAVLDQLDLHALPERGVRLLRLDRDLLEHDPPTLRGTLEGVRFLLEVLHAALVVPVGPPAGLALDLELPSREESACQRTPLWSEVRPNLHVLFKGGVLTPRRPTSRPGLCRSSSGPCP